MQYRLPDESRLNFLILSSTGVQEQPLAPLDPLLPICPLFLNVFLPVYQCLRSSSFAAMWRMFFGHVIRPGAKILTSVARPWYYCCSPTTNTSFSTILHLTHSIFCIVVPPFTVPLTMTLVVA
ncbi:hypothetical protein FRB94_014721 [Tulasnella sp. JGI-2019a]|nr:hypothetical protein FRB94_014721 [Tulasnella sp. JGI-2019a]KAG9012810.1 hypothetical protein FRB93_001364 [Tulasnella sp. JGI-2019a]